jgi:hypothetical protein
MLLEKIPVNITDADFASQFQQIKRNGDTVTFTEAIAGGTMLYRLVFRNNRLSLLNLSINGDFTQDAYNDLSAILKSIIYTQKTRGFTNAPQETGPLAWKELIESPLPDTGSPAERSIQIFNAGWDIPGTKAILNFAWIWPGQLSLDYKEDSE